MDAWPTGMAFVAERQMAARGKWEEREEAVRMSEI